MVDGVQLGVQSRVGYPEKNEKLVTLLHNRGSDTTFCVYVQEKDKVYYYKRREILELRWLLLWWRQKEPVVVLQIDLRKIGEPRPWNPTLSEHEGSTECSWKTKVGTTFITLFSERVSHHKLVKMKKLNLPSFRRFLFICCQLVQKLGGVFELESRSNSVFKSSQE